MAKLIWVCDLSDFAKSEGVQLNELMLCCIAQGVTRWLVVDNLVLYGEL
jgi:hypothetical protein